MPVYKEDKSKSVHASTLILLASKLSVSDSFLANKSGSFVHSSFLMKLIVFLVVLPWVAVFARNFSQDFDLTWGSDRVRILNNGELLTLSLDKDSGSAFQSKNEYLFGKISVQLKLVPGYSAGTVTSYYVSTTDAFYAFPAKILTHDMSLFWLQLASQGSTWDEIDFEFLGNLSGDPYTVHTNVITEGKGDREQQFHLWFDPTADFHTYSILWNPHVIIFYVDGTPIREFKNLDSTKVPFPESRAMRIHSSIWNADDWATKGGLIKTDWSKAPFTASFRNISAQACIWASGSGAYPCSSNSWLAKQLDAPSLERLMWVQKHYMIYNYCIDLKRFPQGLPLECAATT
ncbi:hypothetical protein Goari_011484 [Gossypium aridum]|uniref:Xyloglucan endotransglucosylase/hydrolase n=1 Tax=Gossypium aridum TaxID=34290 RepID=A0A7J8WXH2_GOSAI|nr:hypothetical protein [Gossypium aridum]